MEFYRALKGFKDKFSNFLDFISKKIENKKKIFIKNSKNIFKIFQRMKVLPFFSPKNPSKAFFFLNKNPF